MKKITNTRPQSAEDAAAGQQIVVTIKRLGINGEGVGYYRRKAVFVSGALPQEVVKAHIERIEPGYLQARLIEIEKRSPHRISPPCPVYEACGGCQLQHMDYKGQLQAKEELIREAFSRYANVQFTAPEAGAVLRPVLGMDQPWGYRNKAQLQLGTVAPPGKGPRGIAAGLYVAGTHKLVDITGCAVHHPSLNRAAQEALELIRQLDIPLYDEKRKQGVLRAIVPRISFHSGQLQLTLITATNQLPQKERFIRLLRHRLPELVCLAQNINSGSTSLVFGEETVVLWGEAAIREQLGALTFSLSPRAFFQLNPAQTLKLYHAVEEAAGLTGRELVVDAYCGTGTIGLWLARTAGQVRGIELLPEAIRDAQRNAEQNGIANATFHVGRAEQLLPQWLKQGLKPDVIVVDPPRTGCDTMLLQALLHAKPHKIVYVSCNPSTLAKDCHRLLEGGYRLEWVQPVDMFPMTAHVESCSLLVRNT